MMRAYHSMPGAIYFALLEESYEDAHPFVLVLPLYNVVLHAQAVLAAFRLTLVNHIHSKS